MEQADRVGMPYVSNRWLGGLLTNYTTLSKRIKRMHELRQREEDGSLDLLPTREAMKLRGDLRKLEQNLGGVQGMDRLPAAVFVVDPRKEQIVVKEARKLKIPIVALVDTNCDPDEVDYVIPGNDDAIRSCGLIVRVIADAVAEGRQLLTEAEMKAEAERKAAEAKRKAEEEAAAAAAAEAQAKADAEAAARRRRPPRPRRRRRGGREGRRRGAEAAGRGREVTPAPQARAPEACASAQGRGEARAEAEQAGRAEGRSRPSRKAEKPRQGGEAGEAGREAGASRRPRSRPRS